MKKLTALQVFLFSLIIVARSQPSFQWAAGMGSSGQDAPLGVVTDNSGNVYSAGRFQGTADFDPGSGTANLVSAGADDIFISKLNASGNYVWAKQVGGSGAEWCYAMCSDASGNLLITGNFKGLVDFDPGAGIYTLSTASSTIANTFILKLDQNGNFLWAKQIGNPNQSMTDGRALCGDSNGNIYLTGAIIGGGGSTCDFDPGPGTFTLNPFSGGTFVLKLDQSGNFTWAENFGGAGFTIAADAAGNVYCGGSFIFTGDFDPGPGTFSMTNTGPNGFHDGFVVKLNSNGAFAWARQMGGSGVDGCNYVTIDCQGNVICSGVFTAEFYADSNNSLPTFTTAGTYEVFVSKFDASGNFTWSKRFGGVKEEIVRGLAVDGAGDIYFTGLFAGGGTGTFTADFDPSPATYTLAGGSSMYYCKLDAGGNLVWVYSAGTQGWMLGSGIHVDGAFSVYVTGEFGVTADFDPFAPVVNLTTAGNVDVFVMRLNQTSTLVPVVSSGTGAVCAGQNATLNATWTNTVNWYSSATSTALIGTGTVFVTPALTTNTTYYVSGGQNCYGETIFVPVNVSVVPPPQVSASSNTHVVCTGGAAVLTASGASTYQWSNSMSAQQITVTVMTNTSYVVTGSDVNSCSATATVNIAALPLPAVTASSNNSVVCVGEPAVLTAGGASTYSWNNAMTTQAITVTILTNTTYVVTGSNFNTCSASATVGISASACTDLTDSQLWGSFLIYPNPASGAFILQAENAPANSVFRLQNLLGQQIFEQEIFPGENKISTQLPAGIYAYRIDNNNQLRHTGKLILEH